MIQHLAAPKNRIGLGIILITIASVLLAIQATCVKLASPYLSTPFLTFARSFVNLGMLLLWILFWPKAPKIRNLWQTSNFRYHAVRSFFGVAALYCFYFSITHFSLAVGTLIFFSFPLFVPIVSRIWLRMEFVHRLWWGLGIAFLGLLFVFNPGKDLFNPMSIVPLVGAIFAAKAVVSIRALNYHEEPWERITLYYFVLSVIVTAAVLLLLPSQGEVYTFKSLGLAFLAGFFAAIFQVLLVFAGKFAPMRLVSPFIYLSFIFNAFIQYFFWGQTLTSGEILGFCLISMGTILMIFLHPKDDPTFKPKRKKKKTR